MPEYLPIGELVVWHVRNTRERGTVQHRGIIIAIIPANTSARETLRSLGEQATVFSPALTAPNDRYLVRTYRYIRKPGEAEYVYFAPGTRTVRTPHDVRK